MVENIELYPKLAKIGFRVNSDGPICENLDIEDVLVEACYEVDHDSRMIGLLFSWGLVHRKHIIADKLIRSYSKSKEYLGECPWFYGFCAYLAHLKDHRFKKGLIKWEEKKTIGDRKQDAGLKMKGPIEYLAEYNLMVPNGSIRIRESDILTPEELIKYNRQYRNRYIYGANWRSEIITAIQEGYENANQVAKKLGIERSRAAIVFKEYQLIKEYV